MGEGCLGALLILFLLPVIRAFVCVYRLANPDARGRRSAARELLGCLGWFLVVGVVIALLLPASGGAREAARRSWCMNNLKTVVLAMHNYAEKYGCFPPAFTVDKQGRPLHSWRVLLLPFLEQGPLYERLRLEEPYDSPHNRAVFESLGSGTQGSLAMPDVFRCPSDHGNTTDTNYVMIVGPRTISNGPNCVRLADITDGPSNTIAVAEVYDLGIRWYEPRDLPADQISYRINDPEYWSISSRHPGLALAGLADGTVVCLWDDSAKPNAEETDPRVVEALTTINGGEDVSGVFKAR